MIQECAPCSAQPRVIYAGDEPPIQALEAGLYELVVFVDPELDGAATLRVDRPG